MLSPKTPLKSWLLALAALAGQGIATVADQLAPQPRISNGRSKYKPHQGKRECARRVRQMRGGVL